VVDGIQRGEEEAGDRKRMEMRMGTGIEWEKNGNRNRNRNRNCNGNRNGQTKKVLKGLRVDDSPYIFQVADGVGRGQISECQTRPPVLNYYQYFAFGVHGKYPQSPI
jgi:hypothetical protein